MHKVAVGVNIFNTPQWQMCRDHLFAFKSCLNLFCVQNKDDKIDSTGFERVNCLYRTAKNFVSGSHSNKPIIYEMMDGLSNIGPEYFMLMNSDIILSQECVDWILNQKGYDSACFSRVDFEPESRRNFEVCSPYGFDVFLIKSSWWKLNRMKFLRLPNIYAEPTWDLAYATVLHSNSTCYFHNKIPMIYHLHHEGRWSIKTLEGSYNQNLFSGTKTFSLWYNYFKRTVLSRKYVNGKIPPARISYEINMERRVFGR